MIIGMADWVLWAHPVQIASAYFINFIVQLIFFPGNLYLIYRKNHANFLKNQSGKALKTDEKHRSQIPNDSIFAPIFRFNNI